MGYRELLKKYIRFLELNVGDNYIESAATMKEPLLSKRDISELRTLAGEIYRGAHTAEEIQRVENYNYRLRLLFNRYDVDTNEAARLASVDVDTLNRWRTSPRSPRYLPMSRFEFEAFEAALLRWLEGGARPREGCSRYPRDPGVPGAGQKRNTLRTRHRGEPRRLVPFATTA